MKNEAIARLEPIIGRWDLMMTNAWFLDSLEERVEGWASFEWLDESFIVFRWALGDESPAVQVIGHSDAQDRSQVFYHDDRGVARIFEMELEGVRWSMLREDPDFHQRFTAVIHEDRIEAAWDASEDSGVNWRKDFDLLFTRPADQN
ncbi:MAG TPA: hypothetical protein VG872_13190 [Acidimicrobiia bacterium]|jgi:hypothetical protein|nr:hypothetical protein [Acidimicrobiia bacterium]